MAGTLVVKESMLTLWVVISSWYYGYHLAELNFPEPSLTCPRYASRPGQTLPHCLGLKATEYSVVTSVLTIGGLVGSLATSVLIARVGVWKVITLTAVINLAGSAVMAFATHWVMLLIGRIISGLAAGVAVATVPPLLSHISTTSPCTLISSNRGFIGTLNQLSIVVGLLSAQLVGLATTGVRGDKRGQWRWTVGFSGFVALAQLLIGRCLGGYVEERSGIKQRSGHARSDRESQEPLLATIPEEAPSKNPTTTIPELLANPSIRPHVFLVMFILAAQQLCGIGVIMFYSVPVLKPVVPRSAGLIGIGITALNLLMTLPPLLIVDRIGRIPLLFASLVGVCISSIALTYGLETSSVYLSSIPLLSFVAFFAIGLGPIPFLFVSELVPEEAVAATSSLALASSWLSSFITSVAFLPLQKALTWVERGRVRGRGRIFLGFVFFQVLTVWIVYTRLYKIQERVVVVY